MSWYRCEASLRSSPKVARLARRLGIPTAHARGLLTGLWAWACEARPSGDLTGLDEVDIAFAAEWDGDPGTLEAALVECRLIDVDDSGRRSLHDWADRAEGYHRARVDARRREADRERKAAARASAPRPQTSADVRPASADVRAVSADVRRPSDDVQEVARDRADAACASLETLGAQEVRERAAPRKAGASARNPVASADVRGRAPDSPQTSADARAGEERTERTGEEEEEMLSAEMPAVTSAHAPPALALLPSGRGPDPDEATPERVLAAYVEVMVPAGWVRHSRLTPRLASALKARITSPAERRRLTWWRELFGRVARRVTWPRAKTLETLVRSDDELQAFADGARDDHSSRAPRRADLAERIAARASELEVLR